MTFQDLMKERLKATLSEMLQHGGGNKDKPYLTETQISTISSVIAQKFFIVDRFELYDPLISHETGVGAIRRLTNIPAEEGPIEGYQSEETAAQRFVAAIHDFEVLELSKEWAIQNNIKMNELKKLAFSLYLATQQLNHESSFDDLSWVQQEHYLLIAREAKRQLGREDA